MRTGNALGSFLAGAAAGAAVAILTAPRSGRETRERLKGAARDIGESMRQIPGELKNAGAKAMQAGQSAFEKVKDEASQAFHKPGEDNKSREQKGYGLDKGLPRLTS